MAELETIYRSEERWVEVIGVKMQRAEALQDQEERVRELLEVTELWKKEVNDYDQATPAFEQILAIEPAHQEAFEALERLHTAAGRWETLVELYLNRLETREVVQEKNELLRRIARVFEERLDDKNRPSTRSSTPSVRTSPTTRPRATWSGWRKPPVAGAS